jgi:DNA-binding transcriptional regulator YbjK
MISALTPSARAGMIGEAAIEVLAAHGGRGLTHRAVDRFLNWPEGTTSRYHRTRDSLMNAVVSRLIDVDVMHLQQWEHSQTHRPETTIEDLAAIMRSTWEEWVNGSARQIARYELSLEGRRRPMVHNAIIEGRRMLNASIEHLLVVIGCPESASHATSLVSFLDGLCHDQLLHPEIATDPNLIEDQFVRWLRSC